MTGLLLHRNGILARQALELPDFYTVESYEDSPNFVDVTPCNAAQSGSTVPLTFPAGIRNGDIAILAVWTNQNTTWSTPAGWNVASSQVNNANMSYALYWKRLTGSETSTTVTRTGGTALGTGNGFFTRTWVFRNVEVSSPIEAMTSGPSGGGGDIPYTSSTPTTRSITTLGDNRLVVAIALIDDNVTLDNFPTGTWVAAGPHYPTSTGGDANSVAIISPRASAGSVTAQQIDSNGVGTSPYQNVFTFALKPISNTAGPSFGTLDLSPDAQPVENSLITATASVTADSIFYQWQYETDPGVWANVTSATSATLTPNYATHGVSPFGRKLRVVVTAVDSTGISAKVATFNVNTGTLYFGDGRDGDLNMSGGTLELDGHKQYNRVSFSNSVIIKTNGWRFHAISLNGGSSGTGCTFENNGEQGQAPTLTLPGLGGPGKPREDGLSDVGAGGDGAVGSGGTLTQAATNGGDGVMGLSGSGAGTNGSSPNSTHGTAGAITVTSVPSTRAAIAALKRNELCGSGGGGGGYYYTSGKGAVTDSVGGGGSSGAGMCVVLAMELLGYGTLQSNGALGFNGFDRGSSPAQTSTTRGGSGGPGAALLVSYNINNNWIRQINAPSGTGSGHSLHLTGTGS